MRRLLLVLIIVVFAVWGMTGCKPGLLPTDEAGKPKITLDRVEVMSYFPWADLPARTPIGPWVLCLTSIIPADIMSCWIILSSLSPLKQPRINILKLLPLPITTGFISHPIQQASIES